MTAPGQVIASVGPAKAKGIEIDDRPRPAAMAVHRRPRRPRRSPIYAIWATNGEIDVPRVPPHPYLTQSRLIQKAQAGDIDALQLVWLHNARLGYTIINRHRHRSELMSDAFQESQLGLGGAIRHFDVSRLLAFSTYAFAAMSKAVSRHRTLPGCPARIPAPAIAGYLTFRSKVLHARTRAEWFDAREEYLTRLPAHYDRYLRLHALAEPAPIRAAHSIPSAQPAPDSRLLGLALALDLAASLAQLDPRQRLVIRRRYGLAGRRMRTLEQIGVRIGVTKERVRQIQLAAESAIRAYLTQRGWDTGLVPLQSLS